MKTKNRHLFLILSMLALVWSCEKEIPYTGDDSDSLLVINQIIEKDSTFSIGIERSKFFLENSNGSTELNDALVVLTNTTTGVSETQSTGNNGLYTFNMVAQEGHSYEVLASQSNYPNASSNTSIPLGVSLIDVDTLSLNDPQDGPVMEATFKWNDPIGKNYYIIVVSNVGLFSSPVYMTSNDISITNGGNDIDGEAIYRGFFSLDDETFDGNQKELVVKFQNWDSGAGPTQYKYQLFNCTEDAYRYLVSVNTSLESDNGPFSEPVKVHSNIEGGYGIFVGMNRSQIIK